MLQIATGKLFKRAVRRENQLNAILYTNAVIGYEESVETAIGMLRPSSVRTIRPQVILYEFTERMEEPDQGPFALVSSGVDTYLQDCAVVVAFALNCVCTPDVDLCRRLTDGQRGLSTRVAPQAVVRRFFDGEVWCKPEDRQFLRDFTAKLIGLPRQTFIGVMRALRTYVNGMYRIADDLELAYTLLVASVESLAQDFDKHQSDWESVDEHKRNVLDTALVGADTVIAQRVREAVLAVEHVALARRFREFATAHTTPEYFRPPANTDGPPLGRGDLKEALSLAYQSRSKYVHQLKRLPHVIGHAFGETAVDQRAVHLTLQGLARLMRSVIIEFVSRQPSVDREPYDYALERSGVIKIRLAAQYWIGETEGDIRHSGRNKLEGFLEQWEAHILNKPNATITDLRPVLQLAVEFAPRLEKRYRLPYLSLLVVFNSAVRQEYQAQVTDAVNKLIHQELSEPSSEALLAHTLCEQSAPWSVSEHHQAVESYLQRRGKKTGLRFPRVIEAAVILDLAERFRVGGNMDECRTAVALAVENHPGNTALQELEQELQQDTPIRWSDILVPRRELPAPRMDRH